MNLREQLNRSLYNQNKTAFELNNEVEKEKDTKAKYDRLLQVEKFSSK